MTQFIAGYQEALAVARRKASDLGLSVGIEAAREYGRPGYRLFLFPRPEKRQGHELRCEVVDPEATVA